MARTEIRIISNIIGLDGASGKGLKVKLIPYPKEDIGVFSIFRLFLKSFSCDYIILNFNSFDFFVLAFFKLIFFFNRCRLVTLDLFLLQPENLKEKINRLIKILLLRRAYRFLVYSRNNKGYEIHYRIPGEKFVYVPYKVNALNLIQKTATADAGYIFCGGKSRRDFNALFDAVRENRLPVKIVTVDNRELQRHGSFLDEKAAPENVEIVRHDGSVGRFVEIMANSRMVVIPIKKDIITQAGIAVYLMAMALKKCVIISSGPGVDDVLPEGAAVIVPPGNVAALRQAMERIYQDQAERERVTRAGYDYAMSLKGIISMQEAIENFIYDDYIALRRLRLPQNS
ncbi:MAG: glycosyltransferase [Candidatus Zixiibacteriota bacterium]